LTYYNRGKSYPFLSRDQLVKQVPALRRRFLKYENYKNVQLDNIIEPEKRQKFSKKDVFTFGSVYIENLGTGKLAVYKLPVEAQIFPIFSFCVEDLNDDGNADVLAVGNIDAVQPDFGRYDAGYGLALLGDGTGKFRAVGPQKSGFVVRGQGRSIKSLAGPTDKKVFLVSRNNDTIMVFERPAK
jgi:enediyne biosynthesis protein E4